jgi:phage terminase large subunit GpA-like protein
MPLLFQPSPPPCAKCGTTTVLTPAFEEGQRVFAVRCPACGRAGTYSLDYSAFASGDTRPPVPILEKSPGRSGYGITSRRG